MNTLLLAFLAFAPQDFARDVSDPADLGFTFRKDLVVESVEGPAKKASFKPGDVLRKIEGTDVKSWEDVRRACLVHPLHTKLKIALERGGRPKTLTLKISKKRSAHSGGRGGTNGARKIPFDGGEATVHVKAPPPALKGAPTPLLVILHNGPGKAQTMLEMCAGAGSKAILLSIDDMPRPELKKWVPKVLAAIEDVKKSFNVDLRRIHILGMWNAAWLAYRLGIERGHEFASVGMFSSRGIKVGTPSPRKCAFVFLNIPDVDATPEQSKKLCEELKEKGHATLYIENKWANKARTVHMSALWDTMKKHAIR